MDKQKLNYWTGLLLGLAMTALPFTAQAAGDTPLSLSTRSEEHTSELQSH